jgi:dethiobiotin synthetase
MMAARAGSRRVVVVGAGTGVGKTHLGVALALALSGEGERVLALKPIESGVAAGGTSDAGQLAAASTAVAKDPPPYAFPDPISPHLAARRAGVAIDLATVVAWVDQHTCPWLLVETAGGLLSPLGIGLTNVDLARALRPDVVLLVAQDRLGVLHEIATCCLALRVLAQDLREAVVVLQSPAVPDLSTGTNVDELAVLGLTGQAFAIPRGAPEVPEVRVVAGRVLQHLRALL